MREARIHLRRIKDLLSTNFQVNAYSAVDHLSLSFLSAVSGVDVEGTDICVVSVQYFRITILFSSLIKVSLKVILTSPHLYSSCSVAHNATSYILTPTNYSP